MTAKELIERLLDIPMDLEIHAGSVGDATDYSVVDVEISETTACIVFSR